MNRTGLYMTGMLIGLILSASSPEIPAFADEGTKRHENHPSDEGTGADEKKFSRSDPSPTAIAHPLWLGKLSGKAQDLQMKEFLKALEVKEKAGGSFRKVYARFIDDLGVKRMIDHFEEEDPSCHGILHDLGHVLMERTKDLESSVALCGDGCTYACIHGALKPYLSQYRIKRASPDGRIEKGIAAKRSPQTEKLKKEVNHLCREDSTLVKDFFRGNCAHAVGHGFAQLAKDLPEAKQHCSYFEGIPMQFYCESGMFMELEGSLSDGLFKEGMTAIEEATVAVDFCAQSTDHPSACLRFLLLQAEEPEEVEAVAQKCLALQGGSRRGCFNALGFFSRDYIVSHPAEIDRVCQYGDRIDRKLCASGLSFVKKGHDQKEELLSACQYFKDEELKDLCKQEHQHFYYQVDNPVLSLMFVNK